MILKQKKTARKEISPQTEFTKKFYFKNYYFYFFNNAANGL